VSILETIANEFKKVWAWIDSNKVQNALASAAQLALEAAPIVAEIEAAVPNKTFQEVAAAYQNYGIPFLQAETTDPAQIGNYLLNLGTQLLAKKLPPATASTTLLNTAVQIAVSVLKTK